MTATNPSRRSSLATLPGAWNFRDVGTSAWRGVGRPQTGTLYRSSALTLLGPAGQRRLTDLGIRAVADLRYAREVGAAGVDCVPRTVVVHYLPFADADTGAALHEVPAMRSDQDRLEHMIRHYRLFVRSTGASAAILSVIRLIVDSAPGAVLVHCAAGKDRTGWVCAAVLAAAGVEQDAIVEDFLRSNDAIEDLRQNLLSSSPSADLSDYLVGVRPEYLGAAFDEVRLRHGSMDAFLTHIGVTPPLRQNLAARLSGGLSG